MGLIKCTDVCKSFGEKIALDNVSIDIPEGKIFGLLGPNGAGKSTFLKILSGKLEPTKGEVIITPGDRLSFLQLFDYLIHSFYSFEKYFTL